MGEAKTAVPSVAAVKKVLAKGQAKTAVAEVVRSRAVTNTTVMLNPLCRPKLRRFAASIYDSIVRNNPDMKVPTRVSISAKAETALNAIATAYLVKKLDLLAALYMGTVKPDSSRKSNVRTKRITTTVVGEILGYSNSAIAAKSASVRGIGAMSVQGQRRRRAGVLNKKLATAQVHSGKSGFSLVFKTTSDFCHEYVDAKLGAKLKWEKQALYLVQGALEEYLKTILRAALMTAALSSRKKQKSLRLMNYHFPAIMSVLMATNHVDV